MTTIERPTVGPRGHLITHLRHIDIAVPDYDAQVAFDTGVWGLKSVGTDSGVTYHPQHHSPAIARGPHTALHHAGFELRGVEECSRDVGRVLRAGVEKVWGPGRHQAGKNRSFNDEDKAVFVAPPL